MMPNICTDVMPIKAPEIALLQTFNRVITDILQKHFLDDVDIDVHHQMQLFLDIVSELTISKEAPADYFDFLDSGSFKECYKSGIPNWIIKFCSVENKTISEEQILAAAVEAEVIELFLPTYFINFPFTLNAMNLSSVDSIENMTWDSEQETYIELDIAHSRRQLNGCQLQPNAKVLIHSEWTYTSTETQYNSNPLTLISGEIIRYSTFYALGIFAISWLQDIINVYGDEMFSKFCLFVEQYGLSDLRETNLGYLMINEVNSPVILDWLSQ